MNKQTPLLMSSENPNGWKLEELLGQLNEEILDKCKKIEGEKRPVAKQVLQNNRHIMQMLRDAATLQRQSMAFLEAIGPNEGPLGTPRIGAGSPGIDKS